MIICPDNSDTIYWSMRQKGPIYNRLGALGAVGSPAQRRMGCWHIPSCSPLFFFSLLCLSTCFRFRQSHTLPTNAVSTESIFLPFSPFSPFVCVLILLLSRLVLLNCALCHCVSYTLPYTTPFDIIAKKNSLAVGFCCHRVKQ